jgi:hypothetical protein
MRRHAGEKRSRGIVFKEGARKSLRGTDSVKAEASKLQRM